MILEGWYDNRGLEYGGSHKWRIPQNAWFIVENHIKMDDLGDPPHFRTYVLFIYIYIYTHTILYTLMVFSEYGFHTSHFWNTRGIYAIELIKQSSKTLFLSTIAKNLWLIV